MPKQKPIILNGKYPTNECIRKALEMSKKEYNKMKAEVEKTLSEIRNERKKKIRR